MKLNLHIDGTYDDGLFREFTWYSTKYATVYGYRMDNSSDYDRTDRKLIECLGGWCNQSEIGMDRNILKDKMDLYLVAFVGKDFTEPYFI